MINQILKGVMSRSKLAGFVEGMTMKEVAQVLPSKMRNFILIKALPKSETGFVQYLRRYEIVIYHPH